MPLTHGGFFLGGRPSRNSTISTVVAHPVHGSVHDRSVVDVVNFGHVNVRNRPVVKEMSALPSPAFVAVAEVPVAVVDATVESDHRSPISGKESVTASFPSPVGRSPVIVRLRCQYPCARNPVIPILVIPRPISGSPDVIRAGT